MKQILVAVCIGILILFSTGCKRAEEVRAKVRAQEENRREQILQANANEVVSDIQYIKDMRTGLCFAYYWGGMPEGGPALTTVPCEAIPPQLLKVAK